MAQEMVIRKQMIFSGDVQGVGFRYRSQYAANSCGVIGWVKNEWDGTVHMEAQGTQQAIQEMIRLIQQSRYIRIDHIQEKIIPVESHAYGFHIR